MIRFFLIAFFFLNLKLTLCSMLKAHRSRRPAVARQAEGGSLSPHCQFLTRESIQVYTSCGSGECYAFDPREGEDYCPRLAQHGCVSGACPAGQISCELDESKLPDNADVCDGNIFFHELNLGTSDTQRTDYSVKFKAPPVQTDVYFVADTTQSMETHFSDIQYNIETLLIREDDYALWFGAGQYRDESDFGNDNGFHAQVRITNNYDRLVNVTVSWNGTGGKDNEEANLVALHHIANDAFDRIGWREKSRKFVVLFGDEPGHEPSCLNDGTVITRESVIDDLNARNITVVFINFRRLNKQTKSFPNTGTGCGGARSAPPGQANAIAVATGGKVFAGDEISQFVDFVVDQRTAIKRTYSLDTSDCNGLVKVNSQPSQFTTPSYPINLRQFESAIVFESIRIESGTCNSRSEPFQCSLLYKETGENFSDGGLLHFVDLTGC